MIADVRRPAHPVTQCGEGEHGAEHFRIERRTDVRVLRGAAAEDAAQVEHVDRVTHRDVPGHLTRVPPQRPARAQYAGEHVAVPERHHSAGQILDGVVAGFLTLNADGQHVALLGYDLVAHEHLGAELCVAGTRGDAVQADPGGDDHYRSSPAIAPACWPARTASSDGIAATRAKSRASSPVQSRFSSP